MQYPLPRPRSRSPRPSAAAAAVLDTGLPSLRADAPERRPWQIGAAPDLTSQAARDAALADLDAGFYAPSSRASVRARRKAIEVLLAAWGLEPYPATAQKLKALGASLKAGRYRSFSSILSQWKVDGERRGECWSPALLRLQTDVARSCARGLGPSRQALPLPFDRLGSLPADPRPWVPGGPIGPRNCIIVGAWWMARELELATIRARLAVICPRAPPTATIHLPASKTDAAALGVARSHACVCFGSAQPNCPTHALWDQQLLLRTLFADRHADGMPDMSLPLFPDVRGRAVSKRAMSDTIRHAAALLGMQMETPDGMGFVGGHSLRPTGAQGLTRLGLDSWSVELLGRWGSATVRRYIREAAISEDAARVRAGTLARSLRGVVAAVSEHQRANADLDQDRRLRAAVAAVVPDFLHSWRASLLTELSDAVVRANAAATNPPAPASFSTSSSSSGASSDPEHDVECTAPVAEAPPEQCGESMVQEEVSSSWRGQGKRHRVAIGPPELDPSRWVTICGWKFGLGCNALAPDPSHPECLHCFRRKV